MNKQNEKIMKKYKFNNLKGLTFEYAGFNIDGYMCFYFEDTALYYTKTRINEMLNKNQIIEII